MYVMTLTVITTTSCKDDNEMAGVDLKPDFLLRKISYNGTPRYEFIYDTEGRLIRLNNYGFFEGYILYEYNKQGTIESRKYLASNEKLDDRILFKLDDQSRKIEIEDYTAQSCFRPLFLVPTPLFASKHFYPGRAYKSHNPQTLTARYNSLSRPKGLHPPSLAHVSTLPDN